MKFGLNPELINGKIPKPDNYIRHCMRLVEGNLMSFEEVIAETKTMLAGVRALFKKNRFFLLQEMFGFLSFRDLKLLPMLDPTLF